ncbi:hypothetical protein ACT453_45325, partial [Bacillus sp. D-CC]
TCSGTRGNGFAVMRDNDGFILTLMKGKEVQYPKTFHVGFPQESEEQVDKINQRLKEDGFLVEAPKRIRMCTFRGLNQKSNFLLGVFKIKSRKSLF